MSRADEVMTERIIVAGLTQIRIAIYLLFETRRPGSDSFSHSIDAVGFECIGPLLTLPARVVLGRCLALQ